MSRRPPTPSRIVAYMRDGLETVDEIADAIQASYAAVEDVLSILIASGVAEREPRPTYFQHGQSNRVFFRHRLKGQQQ